MKNIVIIGGGFSGLATANHLARKINRKKVKITLIEPKEENIYEPEYLFWVFQDKPISNLLKPISKLLSKEVNWIKNIATKIDPEKNIVTIENGKNILYDFLILATGARMAQEKLDAYCQTDNVCEFYTKDGVEHLKEKLMEFDGGTIVITPTTVPYKCPPTPIEFAFLLDKYLRKRGIRHKSTIRFLYPLSRAFTMAEPAKKVEKLFAKRNIKFTPFFNFETIDNENNKVLSLEGEEIGYESLIIIPPHEGQDVIKDSGLGDREGWITTDRYTMKHNEHDNIYAIGDGTNLPVSKSGTVSHFSSNILVKNLISELKGKPPKAKYKGLTICFILTSFKKSMLLHFSYNYPPKKYGLNSTLLFGLFKKAFKFAYFKFLIKGRL
ncbi:MAG: NAD(P)/FAD-dependent oxidoreductase [Asgard group archaeon]|nr:NAD(P)/FAD-dependent oxidoreductase [Asgard group archaeon]